MKSFKFSGTLLAVVFLLFCQTAFTQVLDSCDQWANYCDSSYCVYNNLWGEDAGTQCITASTTTSWSVVSNQSGSGVKTYPNSSREPLGVTCGSLISLTSTMNTSSPGTGGYCTAWDIWCPEEVMIWINKYGDVAPWGSYVETATIGGVTWDVYKNGYPGFLTQTNYDTFTVDLKAIIDYCVDKGWLSDSGIIEKVQGGFEITSTDGQDSTFTMNSFSVSIDSTEELEEGPEPAPPSETPVTGVWYQVLAGHSGKALTVEDQSTSSGANVVQWSYEDGYYQQWMLEDADSGYYLLRNRNSDMVLQVQDWSTADGGNVNQGTYGAYLNNQQWSLVKDGDYYEIINRNSGKLVDVVSCSGSNGANIHQWSYYSEDPESQRWSFQTVEAGDNTPTPTDPQTVTSVPTATPTPVATSVNTTPDPTDPPSSGGDICSPSTSVSVPFTQNGSGEYCWETTSSITYINSWCLSLLEINGVDFTNTWAQSSSLPDMIDGKYYIHYVGDYSWSHFEAN